MPSPSFSSTGLALLGVAELPFHHRGPFDRLPVSNARTEGLAIVTGDPVLARYAVELIN